MSESLDQSIREETAIESVEDRQLFRKVNSPSRTRLLIGLSFGLVVLLSGTVLVFSEGLGSLNLEILGFLFFPLGLWITASVALGGLGPSGAYRLRSYRYLWFWWGWIGSRDKEEEGSEKAESAEASEENGKTE